MKISQMVKSAKDHRKDMNYILAGLGVNAEETTSQNYLISKIAEEHKKAEEEEHINNLFFKAGEQLAELCFEGTGGKNE